MDLPSSLSYRIAILGCPARPDVPWTAGNVERLRALGFNTLQLNLAWGYRPADEALNLEDIVEIPADRRGEFDQPVPLRCDLAPERFRARREALRQRIGLCRVANMRSVFHFGAPYNAHQAYGDNPPNCLLDGRTPARYVELLRLFAGQFPGVDDLWLYTYDQDAWLCSEFGRCPRCAGLPLHETVTGFVNRLGQAWNHLRPGGRVWWEPWELSAGQVFRAVALLDTGVTGLALHSNVAEVMAAQPVDRWLQVVSRLAQRAGLPLIVEHVFGSASEEMGAYLHIPCPQLLLRALRAISALPISGIKEYYGLLPERDDPNLELTSVFLRNPDLDDAAILQQLAAPYGEAAVAVVAFWESASDALDLFPWSATWFLREFSRCDPRHGMGAAFLRGQQAHTPSWESSRRSIFMKTDDLQPDPWMLEDVQLQCELAADHAARALEIGRQLAGSVPIPRRADLERGLAELQEWRRRVLSYAYHLRETNLATAMRIQCAEGREIPSRMREEMLALLRADQANQGIENLCGPAIVLLETDIVAFLKSYFVPPSDQRAEPSPDFWTFVPDATQVPDSWSARGAFTVTSR